MPHEDSGRPFEIPFPDWSGRAQLDQRLSGPRLDDLLGLDAREWLVVGLDVGGAAGPAAVRALAVRRADLPEGGDILPRLAEGSGGAVPVTEFAVEGKDAFELLAAVAHVFELRLVSRRLRGRPIEVVDRRTIGRST